MKCELAAIDGKKANILCTRIPDLAEQFSEKNKVSVGKIRFCRIHAIFFAKFFPTDPVFLVGNFLKS